MDKINNIGLARELLKVYDFDGFTPQEVWSRIAQKMNIIIEHFNYLDKKFDNQKELVDSKLNYLLNEGLTEQVSKRIIALVNDGTIGELINGTLLKEINDKVDTFQQTFTEQLDNIKNFVTPEMFGAVGNGTHDDREAIQNAIDYIEKTKKKTYLVLKKHKIYNIASMTGESSKGIILINKYVSIIGGGELKIDDSFNDDYLSIFLWRDEIEETLIKDIIINCNNTNHIPTNSTGIESDKTNRNVFFSYYGGNKLTIENIIVKDFNSVNVIRFANLKQQNIDNSTFIHSENIPPIKFDNSTIWHTGETGSCSNNTFIGVKNSSITAIEVHGRDTITENNTIIKYEQGIIYSPRYIERLGNKNIIINNIIKDVLRGVILWTDELYGCSNVDIKNNNIYINPTLGDGGSIASLNDCYGIGTRVNVETNTPFRNWNIENNDIEFDKNCYVDNISYECNGIKIALVGKTEKTNLLKSYFTDVKIKNNKIINSYTSGIYIFVNVELQAEDYLKNIIISDNDIINPYNNYFNNKFDLNFICGETYNNSSLSAIYVYLSNKQSIKNWIIKNNHFSIYCDKNLKGSRVNELIDIRNIRTDDNKEFKVIDNTFNIDTPILVTTLFCREPLFFKGNVTENDIMACNEATTFYEKGSEIITNRGSKFEFNQLSMKSRDGMENALRIDYVRNKPSERSVYHRGIWYKGNIVFNSLFSASSDTRSWSCSIGGIMEDRLWTASSYFEKGTIFKIGSYNYVVVVSGTSSDLQPETENSNTKNRIDGSMVFQLLDRNTQEPIFV